MLALSDINAITDGIKQGLDIAVTNSHEQLQDLLNLQDFMLALLFSLQTLVSEDTNVITYG